MTCRRIVEMRNDCHMSLYTSAMIALFIIIAGCLAE